MSWRNTLFDGPGFQVTADPPWLLAPLFVRDLQGLEVTGSSTVPGPLTGTLPRLAAPITELASDRQADRAAMLVSAAVDWPRWWASALDFRPGGPAPRQTDLVAHSPALSGLWPRSERFFDGWLSTRVPTPDTGSATEHRLLDVLAERFSERPAPRSLCLLVLPVSGAFLLRAASDRVVVSAELRADPARYAVALGTALSDFFFSGGSLSPGGHAV